MLTQPKIIQGGMGIGVSNWEMARAVSQCGQLGVVSGTAIDNVLVRRLQLGDADGHMRRALRAFPNKKMIEPILHRYFIEGGKDPNVPFLAAHKLVVHQTHPARELLVVSSFVEVWLAKDGHDGLVGINFLEKVQMANGASILGAMMAGVDYVLMGAGLPREIPHFIKEISLGNTAQLSIEVKNATKPISIEINPKEFIPESDFPIKRPQFLAIISSDILATYLAREEITKPDGFIIESSIAGGHNAPPRGKIVLDENNEPIYGPRDEPNLEKIKALALPFWLAGGFGKPEQLISALETGATGIQVGTIFALCEESGFTKELRAQVLEQLDCGELDIHTDLLASPTSFPIKIVNIENSASDVNIYQQREKLCDLGYLRTPVEFASGRIGYRCSGEPDRAFVKKGGDAQALIGRKCLCNGLMSNIGLPQHRLSGYVEPTLLTLGSDVAGLKELHSRYKNGWSAKAAISYLLGV